MVTRVSHPAMPIQAGTRLTRFFGACHVSKLIPAVVLLSLAVAFPVAAHVFDHPEWDEWFAAQRVPDGTGAVCCDKSDVYLLDDEDVRIVDGQYEARVNSVWLQFPNTGQGKPGNKVFGYTANPTGSYVVWVLHGLPRCLAEGTGT